LDDSVGAVTVMAGTDTAVFAFSRFSFSFAASSAFDLSISTFFAFLISRSLKSARASNSCFSSLEYVLIRPCGFELVLSTKPGVPMEDVLETEEIRLI
jgi:hypothetical protein